MDSQAKSPLSKPLNPYAKSFTPPNARQCTPPRAKPFNDRPKDVKQMLGEHTQPLSDKVPVSPQKMCYSFVYVHSQAMLLADLTATGNGTGYSLPPRRCQLPLGSGFYDTSLHDRKVSKAEERIAEQRHGRMCMKRHRIVDPVLKRVQTKWRVKGENKKSTGNTGVRPIIPFPKTLEETERTGITTAMIRNVPNQFRLEDLLKILDDHCYKENLSSEADAWSKYDFVYLPMDYRRHAYERRLTNLGYAFVNFTSPKAAFKFCEEYRGYEWQVTENRKICEIAVADFQGKEELKKKLQKIFRCHCCKFLPVEFFPPRDGFNRRTEGNVVGKYVRGLPRTRIGS